MENQIRNLPIEIQWHIMKFTRHPLAEIVSKHIDEYDKYLHEMSKLNHCTYTSLKDDPDFSFGMYTHYEYEAARMVNPYDIEPYDLSPPASDDESDISHP